MILQRALNELASLGLQAGVIVILGLIGAALFRRSFRLRWFAVAIVLFLFYDFLLTRGFFALPNFPADAGWNWLGKAMAVIGSLMIAFLPAFGRRRVGLTRDQGNNPWLAYGLTAALAVLVLYLSMIGGDGRSDWETIAFQWTMPGLDEEIFYRGVFLLAMNEAFVRKINILGAPIGYGGLLTSVLFGLVHSLELSAGQAQFNLDAFLWTGAPSLLLLWLRERTGSLVLPILAHNMSNGLQSLF
ncbi:MAG: CPBP family glutamic-type intramembrane protease [Pseudomonadota bacterium]